MDLGLREVTLVGLGGALGAILRFVMYGLLQETSFPWATLAVNVIGSFALGFLFFYVIMDSAHSDVLSLFVMMGILGGFTTFSSFSMNTVILYIDKGALMATLNVVLNVFLCIGGAAIGRYIALRLI